jgi:hypothetical protein
VTTMNIDLWYGLYVLPNVLIDSSTPLIALKISEPPMSPGYKVVLIQ